MTAEPTDIKAMALEIERLCGEDENEDLDEDEIIDEVMRLFPTATVADVMKALILAGCEGPDDLIDCLHDAGVRDEVIEAFEAEFAALRAGKGQRQPS